MRTSEKKRLAAIEAEIDLLPNCQMRLRALASMRKVSPAVRAAAAALLAPEVPAGPPPPPEPA